MSHRDSARRRAGAEEGEIEQLRKYVDLAGLDHPLHWVAVVLLAIGVSGLEALGALLIYALLGLISGAEDAVELPVVGDLRGILPDVAPNTLLLGTAGLVAAFFILRALVVLGSEYVAARVTEGAGARLARRLSGGYLTMPYAFHLQRNSAELIRNTYSTVQEVVREGFLPIVRIVSEGFVVLALLCVLFVAAPYATLLAVAVLGTTGLLLLRLVYPRLKVLGAENQRARRSTLQSLQQSLEGMRDIKVLGREAFFAAEFAAARNWMAKVRYRRALLSAVPGVVLETIIVLVIAGAFGIMVLVEGAAVDAIPLLALFGYTGLRLKPSLKTMAKSVNALRFAAAGVDDLHEDLRSIEGREGRERPGEGVRLPFEHEIRLVNVAFRYPGTGSDALRGMDLTIGKGESIGIVGPTGGGKTTLMDVLMGLLAPTQGEVLVDGRNIRGREGAWHRNIGVVPQSIFLVDDTLRSNIALGVAEEGVDEHRLQRAVDVAQLRPVIEALPDGLDTVVGERGERLSGGQRQRVAIARALYREPRVLVFDEGTSALDTATEAQLLASLQLLRQDYTLITVAHRLATVRDSDRMVLVADGRISDTGSYSELLRSSHRFREMAVESPAGASTGGR